MTKAQDYRLLAAECFRTADLLDDPAAKASMQAMARVWQSLADQAEQHERARLGGEDA